MKVMKEDDEGGEFSGFGDKFCGIGDEC